MSRPRTKEEFDKWYNESGGDPWHYYSSGIKSRLKNSLDFILNFIPRDFKGTLVELGAFNGDFTKLLCSSFKNADIIANDISEVAINIAKGKINNCTNVTFVLKDLLNFNSNDVSTKKEIVLLLLECLYYLKPGEREEAISTFKKEFPESVIFLSAPITGSHYFTEEKLLEIMENNNYKLIAHKVLNIRMFSQFRFFIKKLADSSSFIRRNFANQVIYYFKPKEIR